MTVEPIEQLARHMAPTLATDIAQGCVLTIGNFDGVHLGHQSLIHAARKEGNTRGLPVNDIRREAQGH